MGFLDKLFGAKKDYPALDQTSPAAGQLAGLMQSLAKLAGEIPDPLEIVPADNSAYIFIGNPPKKFGIAWIDADGKIINFKTLVEEHGLSMVSLEKLSNRLKEIYTSHQDEARFSSTIIDRQVVITPSDKLLTAVKQVIDDTMNPEQRLKTAAE